MDIANRRWSEGDFFKRRQVVLRQWHTGAEVDLDEAIAFHKKLPKEKDYNYALGKAKREGRILVETVIGHALVEEVIRDMRLCAKAGASSAYVPAGAYTRAAMYAMTEHAVEESVKKGGSLLHEYPVVCHGVKGMRRIVEDPEGFCIVGQGFGQECARYAACLQTEISLAGGVKNAGCHDLHDLLQHCRDFPLDERIIDNQYVARLLAYYEEHGVSMAACLWGNGNGWTPPSILIAMEMIQCLLVAEQGVKRIVLNLTTHGNLIQDVAAWRSLRELAREYLDRFGYHDIELSLLSSAMAGGWPREEYRAAGLLAWSIAESALAPVDDCYIKSLREAVTTPMEDAMPNATRIARQVIHMLKGQRLADSAEFLLEQEMTKKEVRAIVDKVIELGDGDPVRGEVQAVAQGVLDTTFPAWVHAMGKVVPVRDVNGAMRYYRYGNLPFTKEIIQYQQEKIKERGTQDKVEVDIRTVAKDITRFSGDLD